MKKLEMKKLIAIFMASFLLGYVIEPGKKTEPQKTPIVQGKFDNFHSIVIIGGCEYGVNYISNGKIYAHLGTCTQCWTRLQKMINEATGNSQLEKK